MKWIEHPWMVLLACTLAAAPGVGCSDPTSRNPGALNLGPADAGGGGGEVEFSGDCPADPGWMPSGGGPPPEVAMQFPATHPSPECPFYQGAMTNFLRATYPAFDNGDPALVAYPTIDDIFTHATPPDLAPAGQHRGTANRAWLGLIKQAGFRQILIDQQGHTLFYGIHVNQAFVDFINAHNLHTVDDVVNADPTIFFPEGVVELKTAWMDIDPADGDFDQKAFDDNFVTTMAWVPTLHQDPATKRITEDRNHPRLIKVALLALHSVYTFPGHPEFIWGSVQHISPNDPAGDAHLQATPIGWHADSAPTTDFAPDPLDPGNKMKPGMPAEAERFSDYLLYSPGTPINRGSQTLAETELTLNEATQSFPKSQASSVYRLFPGSKSNEISPDDDVLSINQNFQALAKQMASTLKPRDKRSHYALVGAQWLDKPQLIFKLNETFQNDSTSPLYDLSSADQEMPFADVAQHEDRMAALHDGVVPADDLIANGSDSVFSLSGGEDRMSSTAMESFTQPSDSFRNCFSCHNTGPVNANGTPYLPGDTKLLDAKLINVSHVFGEFVLGETIGD
jgi:hypothetical protein